MTYFSLGPFIVNNKFQGLTLTIGRGMFLQSSNPLIGWTPHKITRRV